MRQSEQNKLTEKFLKCISNHLYSRNDLKDVEYIVEISNQDNYDLVSVTPRIEVFPNTHQRKQSDKRTVAQHVVFYHFKDIIAGIDNDGEAKVSKGNLTSGTYVFMKFPFTKRRKWKRIK